MKGFLRSVVFVSCILGIWQMLFMLRIWPEFLFPSPHQVGLSLFHGFFEHDYPLAILASLKRLIIGYLLSLVFGILLGILIAASELADHTIGKLILGLQTLPSICWLPLALLWFGLNDLAIIFVIVAGSVLSMTTATKSAILQVPVIWVRAGRNMGAGGLRLYLHIVVPAALPTMLEGMRQGWAFAWRSLMGGELLFVTAGLGHLMNMGRELNDMSQVIAVMIVITSIGLLTDLILFTVAEKRLARAWGFKKS